MTLLGRQLPSQGGLFRGFGQACGPRQVRPLTSRPLARRTANKRLCTDATLAHDTPESALPQRLDTEALLLRRYKAHDAAVTATLVLDDKGTRRMLAAVTVISPLCGLKLMSPMKLSTGDTKEVVTASLDKSLALWRLQVLFGNITLACPKISHPLAAQLSLCFHRTLPCQILSQAQVDCPRLSGSQLKLVPFSALLLTPLRLATTTIKSSVATWRRA